MLSLREKLEQGRDFLCGVELVSTRGSMLEEQAVRVRGFASDLGASSAVDWVSITDNAGGNPMLAPAALGRPLLYAGKEVVIHLSCKDFNRNGLESEAWHLHSEGFQNLLVLSGDAPRGGDSGGAKPVFDIDSVGLLALLERMNQGLVLAPERDGKRRRLASTSFFPGAVVNNFKLHEHEVIPQYLKLEKKIECGARFIINQIGYDARKTHELIAWLARRGLSWVPLIGNVFVLSPRVARLFHSGKIPGVVVTDDLLRIVERHAASPDRGRAFFLELAARHVAILRGLGFRGVYLGGLHDIADVEAILNLERSFGANDWLEFARELRHSRPGEFYLLEARSESGLCDPERLSAEYEQGLQAHGKGSQLFSMHHLSGLVHDLAFRPGSRLFRLGAHLASHARDTSQGPGWLRWIEKTSKSVLFDCRDCGDCSLPDVAFLCPESQCAKNQRNGPCGGTRDGKCEVNEKECVWSRAYLRLKAAGREWELLDHAPVVQDQGLRGTSSWANAWLGKDHHGRSAREEEAHRPTPEPSPSTPGAPSGPDLPEASGTGPIQGEPVQKEAS